MKPLAKSKHKHRNGPLHTRSCNAGTVMIASALMFFFGLLRGHFSSPAKVSPTGPVASVSAQASAGTGLSRELAEEGRRVPLPHYEPFAHGETGEGEVEHVAFQVLSWRPRAYIFPGFADNETCDKIVALAKRAMAPSGLALKAGESENDQKGTRTSTGAYFSGSQDPSGALAWVERKMARVTAVPVEHGEAFNILRYEPGQQYKAHMDTFDPKDYGPQPSNRIASFLLYLSTPEEGGETVFPHENGEVRTTRFDECVGLKVKPRKGDALLFWSMTPKRQIDETALHAGCSVMKGEKWVATKWLRDGNGL